MALVYVTLRELDLLSAYRQAPEEARTLMEGLAAANTEGESGAGTAHNS